MKQASTPIIDICIPTYKRPLLLKKLIESIVNQKTDDLFTYSLVIVDNDPEQSAKNIIQNMGNTQITISYYCQPEKNISMTRNLAVQKCTGDYMAFIDDDEYPCRDWLLKLFLCLKKYAADCVHGPVISYFTEDTPKWIIKSRFLDRKRFKTGTIIDEGRTGNCLINSKVVKQFDIPFDPELGLTGGEDTAFFREIIKKGHTMIWCDEAESYEYVSPHRATLKWLLQRSFRGGNGYGLRENKKKHLTVKLKNLAMSLAKFTFVLVLFPIYLFMALFDIRYFVKPITKLTGYCGQIAAFWGYEYKEYK